MADLPVLPPDSPAALAHLEPDALQAWLADLQRQTETLYADAHRQIATITQEISRRHTAVLEAWVASLGAALAQERAAKEAALQQAQFLRNQFPVAQTAAWDTLWEAITRYVDAWQAEDPWISRHAAIQAVENALKREFGLRRDDAFTRGRLANFPQARVPDALAFLASLPRPYSRRMRRALRDRATQAPHAQASRTPDPTPAMPLAWGSREGHRLRHLLAERGLTARALSGRLSCPRRAVTDWCAGRAAPPPALWDALARCLGLTVDQLCGKVAP